MKWSFVSASVVKTHQWIFWSVSATYRATQIKSWAVLTFKWSSPLPSNELTRFSGPDNILCAEQNVYVHLRIYKWCDMRVVYVLVDCHGFLSPTTFFSLPQKLESSLLGSSAAAAKSIRNVNRCRLRWFQWLAQRLSPNFPRSPPFYLSRKYNLHNKSISVPCWNYGLAPRWKPASSSWWAPTRHERRHVLMSLDLCVWALHRHDVGEGLTLGKHVLFGFKVFYNGSDRCSQG